MLCVREILQEGGNFTWSFLRLWEISGGELLYFSLQILNLLIFSEIGMKKLSGFKKKKYYKIVIEPPIDSWLPQL